MFLQRRLKNTKNKKCSWSVTIRTVGLHVLLSFQLRRVPSDFSLICCMIDFNVGFSHDATQTYQFLTFYLRNNVILMRKQKQCISYPEDVWQAYSGNGLKLAPNFCRQKSFFLTVQQGKLNACVIYVYFGHRRGIGCISKRQLHSDSVFEMHFTIKPC